MAPGALLNGKEVNGQYHLDDDHRDISTENTTKRYPPTGLSVLVVGAGIGGMTAALECWRKGHDVHIIERNSDMSQHGDVLVVNISARRWLKQWPEMRQDYKELSDQTVWFTTYKHSGEQINALQPFTATPTQGGPWGDDAPVRDYTRPRFANLLLRQVRRCGIPITFGKRAVEYYDNKDSPVAGVITEDGERFEAGIVIAADGIGSKSQELLFDPDMHSRSIGKSLYRAGYEAERALADPMVREYFSPPNDRDSATAMLIGPAAHAVVHIDQKSIAWAFVHSTTGTEKESWNHSVPVDEVLAALDQNGGWSEAMYHVVKTAPPDTIRNWPLVMREPSPSWCSPAGRVLQLGDAAHANLPSSAFGAGAAIEDGVSIAACLQLARHDVPLATAVHGKLRFARCSLAQQMGLKNMQRWQHVDYDALRKDPLRAAPKSPQWIMRHDPEAYVYENFGRAADDVLGGAHFENTNIPSGSPYVPWTLDDMISKVRKGEQIPVHGDWS